MLIADEVMCGWGRTGEWFAVNHWDVVPDIITTAKGLTSSYAPLGAVGLAPHVAEYFDDNVFWGGLTYNTHPLGVAAAIAAVQVIEDDDLVGNAQAARTGDAARTTRTLAAKHPSVGRSRNIGLFGILELVRNRETLEPLSPFNQMNETMQQVNRFLIDNGLATFIRWWNVMTNPPLCINEEQLGRGLRDHRRALDDRRRRDGGLPVGERIGFIGLGIMGKPMARKPARGRLPAGGALPGPGPVDEVVAAGAAARDGPGVGGRRQRHHDHDAARHGRRRAGSRGHAAA